MFGSNFVTNPRPGRDSPFLAKYSGAGELQWVRFVEVLDRGGLLDVAVDANGWIWVTGTTTTNGGSIITARYNPSGEMVWATRAAEGDTWGTSSYKLEVDSLGNACVVGTYAMMTNAWFGDFLLKNEPNWDYPHGVYQNGFVAKYGPDGQVLSAKAMAGSMQEYAYATALDRDGNCYVTGEYNSPVLFLDGVALTNAGGPSSYPNDPFLAKYDPDGHLLWAKAFGVFGRDSSYRLALDPAGNCFVVGYTDPPADDDWTVYIAKLETSLPPPLTICQGTNDILLSWSLLAEGFYLESSDGVNQPSSWSSNSVVPVTVGLSNVVTLPLSTTQRFYRLQRP